MPTRPKLDTDQRIVLLHGKELFLRSEYTAMLRGNLVKAHGEIDTFAFDGSSASPAEVLDECRSFGLMCAHKLVVVDEADKMVNAATKELFLRYAKAPSDGATLLMRADAWKQTNVAKAIGSVGEVIKCAEPTEEIAHRWIIRRAQHTHAVTLEREAAGMLIDRLGPDLARLDSELAKLATGAGKDGTIGVGLVGELVGGGREIKPWDIQSELLSGNPERAVGMVGRILDNAPRDAHIPVVFACVGLARTIHKACCAIHDGQNPNTVAKAVGLWGPARDPVLRAGGRLEPAQSLRLLESTLAMETAMKTGLGTPARLLERLALDFVDTLTTPAGSAR